MGMHAFYGKNFDYFICGSCGFDSESYLDFLDHFATEQHTNSLTEESYE